MNLTLEQLDHEIAEKTLDLEAFRRAYDLIRFRMKETEDAPSLVTPLYLWSGAIGLKLIMEPLINNMQHVLDELKQIRDSEFPDQPVSPTTFNLRLVE